MNKKLKTKLENISNWMIKKMQYITICKKLLKQYLQGNWWHLIKFKMTYLNFQLKKLERRKQIKLKINRKNKIIIAEINEIKLVGV